MGDHERKPKQGSIPNWLFYIVTLVVVGLWGAGIVISFASSSFQMPSSLNAALPVVLTGLYLSKAATDRKKDGGDDDD